ncbi:MAG: hypothetical protein ACI9LO_002303 [Planctomycetota bacterium]
MPDWNILLGGFGLLSLASLLNNFYHYTPLNTNIDTEDTIAIVVLVGGFTVGLVILAIGMTRWIPALHCAPDCPRTISNLAQDPESQSIERDYYLIYCRIGVKRR